jgi:hypothetical protein
MSITTSESESYRLKTSVTALNAKESSVCRFRDKKVACLLIILPWTWRAVPTKPQACENSLSDMLKNTSMYDDIIKFVRSNLKG